MPAVPPVVGNGRADDRSVERTSAGVSDGFADSISAATPETNGAEKLVPTDGLLPSLNVLVVGVVVPALVAVRIGKRHTPLRLTQLPPGAESATSGPTSEKPTVVPT